MKKHIPNILTLANLGFGFLSILFSIQSQFDYAAILLIVCVVLDFFDGKLARKFNSTSAMGAQLDSLADLISFGASPAVLFYTLHPSDYTILIAVIFVLCGAYRLARFNSVKTKDFVGVPITLNGIIFPVLFFAAVNEFIFQIVVIIMSYLMVSKIRVKKLG